jgi:hypothetical protein
MGRNKKQKDKNEKFKRKVYEKELRKLQVQLCYLQEWIKSEGQRIIIVFEGRDAAGKGGTIKALTERVSPRVFRVVALPTPSEREKTQMFIQRYMERFPAAGEVIIFDRSWYNRAGVERVMGFVDEKQVYALPGTLPGNRKVYRWRRYQVDQDLARSRNERARKALRCPGRRSAPAMEAQPDGCGIIRALVRLFTSTRCYAEGDGQQGCAVGDRAFGRQAAGSAELHLTHPEQHSVQKGSSPEGEAPSKVQQGCV